MAVSKRFRLLSMIKSECVVIDVDLVLLAPLVPAPRLNASGLSVCAVHLCLQPLHQYLSPTTLHDSLKSFGKMGADEICILDPTVFLAANDHPERSANPPDLLILNQPITDFATFSRLWKHSQFRICADGGANRLHDMFVGDIEGQREDFVRGQTLYVTRTMY